MSGSENQAILALDQGTTSSRAIVFDRAGHPVSAAQASFHQHFPANAWVEHDPEEIWRTTLSTARKALCEAAARGHDIVAIGIANQRETVIVWDRATGEPIHNAIVWQDRRTAGVCADLQAAGHGPDIAARTGLIIDPYFSATKIAWLLDNVPGARARAERGELAAGTVDSFLIWRLTDGAVHATDATNASRTSLFNIHSQEWDDTLLGLFAVPRAILPDVFDSAASFGMSTPDLLGACLPIAGVAGDQQAAAIGQACFTPGSVKATYGTGCFVLVNTGRVPVRSGQGLLTTVACRLNGETFYAVEGSIFIAGAAVQWLRDAVGVLTHSAETAERAAHAADDAQVVMVPAFTGMGAPHWSPHARAAVFGMTRASGPNELSRAALDGVVYQTHDLLTAFADDGLDLSTVRIDGGMAANDWFVQRLADILDRPVERPAVLETTALGAACLAGLQTGLFASLDDVSANWARQASFTPQLSHTERVSHLKRWRACVDAVLSVAELEAAS